jgi:cadmium resistance protein CadD (predicted permease)
MLSQLGNSTDTIITYSVLFSDANELADYLVLASFAGMALVLVLVAYLALRHPWLSRPVQLYGHYITPLILITVGMFVLSNTALDMLPGT